MYPTERKRYIILTYRYTNLPTIRIIYILCQDRIKCR